MKLKILFLLAFTFLVKITYAQTKPEYEKCYEKYSKKGGVKVDKGICEGSSSLDKCLCRNYRKKEDYLKKLKRLESLNSQETIRLSGLVKNYNKYYNLAREIQVKLYGTDVENFDSKKRQAISYYKSASSSLNFYNLRFLCSEIKYKPRCESIKKDKASRLKSVDDAIEELENLKPTVSATFSLGTTSTGKTTEKEKEKEKKEIEDKVNDYIITQELINDLPNMKKRAEYYKKIGDWENYNKQMEVINHVKNNLLNEQQRKQESVNDFVDHTSRFFSALANSDFSGVHLRISTGFRTISKENEMAFYDGNESDGSRIISDMLESTSFEVGIRTRRLGLSFGGSFSNGTVGILGLHHATLNGLYTNSRGKNILSVGILGEIGFGSYEFDENEFQGVNGSNRISASVTYYSPGLFVTLLNDIIYFSYNYGWVSGNKEISTCCGSSKKDDAISLESNYSKIGFGINIKF